ncbi:GTP-binding protein [Candidatus Gracilibacteria bacterium]|jgi:small GTP-binding protein|nr:GTP-binding protein [Candidatus Gracilibacteria bacterium]NJM87345.1 GTP-binding protein [Hydrococcus sp. RU_2_2]NJP22279.1 GTP-binding protein [Hydrococcus sp. CRU_1_1]
MSVISKKICFLGDYGVGKTSLIRRFVDRQFSDQYLSTLGVKISRKLVEIPKQNSLESQQIQLLIWDLEGRTKFHAITPSYLQGATGAVIVADINRQDTIDRVREHAQLATSVNPKGIKLIVALNKADLQEDEFYETEKFSDYPEIIVTYMTSAKTGQNVDEIFQKLTHSMMKRTNI